MIPPPAEDPSKSLSKPNLGISAVFATAFVSFFNWLKIA